MQKAKKTLAVIMTAGAVLTLITGLAGCGQQNADTSGNQGTQQMQQQGQNGSGNTTGAGSGDRQRSRPSIFGKVKSIVGNEVEIELAKMPERPKGQNGERPKKQNSGSNNGGGAPSGMPPGMGGGMRSASNLELTGEVKTVTIPVGVPIEQRSGQEMKQIDIADIYAGSVIQIWTDANDKTMITRVTVNAQSSSNSSQ